MPRFASVSVAARTLRTQRGFTIVVILSLALAIALNTTMYSVLDALIHPRVDVREPDQLYHIQLYGDYRGRASFAARDSALLSGLPSIEAIAPTSFVNVSMVQLGAHYAETGVSVVTPSYFDVLGPRLVAGRTFVPDDANATMPPIVISESLLPELLPDGGDPLGQQVTIDDHAFVVVARIAAVAGEPRAAVAFRMKRINDPQFRLAIFHKALILSVVALLLVACANLANLQLARGIGRQRELAVRTALGASRRQIIAHLMMEVGLLAAAGLALGLVLTYWGTVAVRTLIPPQIGEYIVQPHVNLRVLLFAVAVTIVCLLLVGVLPSIRVSRVDPNELLKSGAGTGATKRHRRQYGYLVAVEMALALGLLSGASVMVRSALRFTDDVLGYDAVPIYTGFFIGPRSEPRSRAMSDVLQDLVNRVDHRPSIASAAATMRRSVDHHAVTVSDSARGVRTIPAPNYSVTIVSPDYFRTIGQPIVRGRDFMDGERDEPAIIVDEFTAQSVWPGANPIGAMMKLGDMRSKAPFVRVVGVVKNARREPDRNEGPTSTLAGRLGTIAYLPGAHDSVTIGGRSSLLGFVIARAAGDPAAVPLDLHRAGVRGIRSLGDDVKQAQATRRFIAALFLLFASLGVGLAAFGIYGIVSHSVAERRREMGVRIALGATARDILRAILRDSVVIALAGAAAGLLATKYGVMFLRTYAFEDDLYNAPMFAGAAAALLVVAAASAYLPALRATRIDPTESLRSE